MFYAASVLAPWAVGSERHIEITLPPTPTKLKIHVSGLLLSGYKRLGFRIEISQGLSLACNKGYSARTTARWVFPPAGAQLTTP
ncbi:MAG: hypothetical protein QOI13_1043 [Paraburkholderia sp.]|nr:hypothetical protein [Paraburkholderia sp.]